VFDYWLLGQYPNEQDMQAVQKGQAGAPIGKPLLAAELPWPPRVSAEPVIASGATPVPTR
jgi:penicillin-binding protein 2